MCFFITVAVASHHADRIVEEFARGFQVVPTRNASVLSALPVGYSARTILRDGCSCGLYARAETAEDPAVHLRRRYQERGWGEAKIARALEQIRSKQSRAIRPEPGFHADILRGLEKICRAAGSVAVLVHWYNGAIDTERFDPGPGCRCACDEIAAAAQTLGEDRVLICSDR